MVRTQFASAVGDEPQALLGITTLLVGVEGLEPPTLSL